jgi:hypothetical protein
MKTPDSHKPSYLQNRIPKKLESSQKAENQLGVSGGYIRLMADLLSLQNHGDLQWAQEMSVQLEEIESDEGRLAALANAVDEHLDRLPEQYCIALRLRYDLANPESDSVKSYTFVGSRLKRKSNEEMGVSKARVLQLLSIGHGKLRQSAYRNPIFGFVPYGFLSRC